MKALSIWKFLETFRASNKAYNANDIRQKNWMTKFISKFDNLKQFSVRGHNLMPSLMKIDFDDWVISFLNWYFSVYKLLRLLLSWSRPKIKVRQEKAISFPIFAPQRMKKQQSREREGTKNGVKWRWGESEGRKSNLPPKMVWRPPRTKMWNRLGLSKSLIEMQGGYIMRTCTLFRRKTFVVFVLCSYR